MGGGQTLQDITNELGINIDTTKKWIGRYDPARYDAELQIELAGQIPAEAWLTRATAETFQRLPSIFKTFQLVTEGDVFSPHCCR